MNERDSAPAGGAGPVDVDDPATGTLARSVISAIAWQGFTITTADGRPATLAVIDDAGVIVEYGPSVTREVWSVAVLSYRRFLKGEGCLRVYSSPTGRFQEERD